MLYFFCTCNRCKQTKIKLKLTVCNPFPCISLSAWNSSYVFCDVPAFPSCHTLVCFVNCRQLFIYLYNTIGRQILTANSSWNLALSLVHRSSTCCRKDFLLTGLTGERSNTESEKEMYKNSTTICQFLYVYSRLQHAILSMNTGWLT